MPSDRQQPVKRFSLLCRIRSGHLLLVIEWRTVSLLLRFPIKPACLLVSLAAALSLYGRADNRREWIETYWLYLLMSPRLRRGVGLY